MALSLSFPFRDVNTASSYDVVDMSYTDIDGFLAQLGQYLAGKLNVTQGLDFGNLFPRAHAINTSRSTNQWSLKIDKNVYSGVTNDVTNLAALKTDIDEFPSKGPHANVVHTALIQVLEKTLTSMVVDHTRDNSLTDSSVTERVNSALTMAHTVVSINMKKTLTCAAVPNDIQVLTHALVEQVNRKAATKPLLTSVVQDQNYGVAFAVLEGDNDSVFTSDIYRFENEHLRRLALRYFLHVIAKYISLVASDFTQSRKNELKNDVKDVREKLDAMIEFYCHDRTHETHETPRHAHETHRHTHETLQYEHDDSEREATARRKYIYMQLPHRYGQRELHATSPSSPSGPSLSSTLPPSPGRGDNNKSGMPSSPTIMEHFDDLVNWKGGRRQNQPCIVDCPGAVVYAVGDLEGRLDLLMDWLISCEFVRLRGSNANDARLEWIAHPLVFVVQTGDQVDAKRQENKKSASLDLLVPFFMDYLAVVSGDKVLSGYGNHEDINLSRTYLSNMLEKKFHFVHQKNAEILNTHERRFALFTPGGIMSNIMDRQNLIVRINDAIFSHAGLRQVDFERARALCVPPIRVSALALDVPLLNGINALVARRNSPDLLETEYNFAFNADYNYDCLVWHRGYAMDSKYDNTQAFDSNLEPTHQWTQKNKSQIIETFYDELGIRLNVCGHNKIPRIYSDACLVVRRKSEDDTVADTVAPMAVTPKNTEKIDGYEHYRAILMIDTLQPEVFQDDVPSKSSIPCVRMSSTRDHPTRFTEFLRIVNSSDEHSLFVKSDLGQSIIYELHAKLNALADTLDTTKSIDDKEKRVAIDQDTVRRVHLQKEAMNRMMQQLKIQ